MRKLVRELRQVLGLVGRGRARTALSRTVLAFSPTQLYSQPVYSHDARNETVLARPSPLGKDDETVFWHNYRTNCSPNAAIFVANGGERWYAFRMELIVVG